MKGLIFILVGVLVLGGTAIGLGYAGIINIPGITPKKAPAKSSSPAQDTASNQTPKSGDAAPTTPVVAPKPEPKAEEPTPDKPKPVQRVDGTDRVAKLWASMDSETLSKVLTKWNDGDVLAILAKMDDKKLAELLNTIASTDPDRAARISQGIKSMEKGGR